ncbi:hypothetical protein PVAP13_6NG208203 [Panicum virgatum]|uniref:Uncharacterized protein n=1 Tax=Panicum virgatum TaxID=38727 RepID=A0A8T0QWM0_PANVG|nr:hypothetical protein PVAP13_6NG208203 [Panicum virgatum]
MEGALEDDEDGLMETKCDTEKSPEQSSGNDNSPSIDAQQAPVQINNGATEDHTSLSNEQRIAMEGHADKGDAGTNLRSDTIQTNMRSRRVKAPSLNRSESCEMEVYLISLRNKGRVAAKGTLRLLIANELLVEACLERNLLVFMLTELKIREMRSYLDHSIVFVL